MNNTAMNRLVLAALEDLKATDIITLDIRKLTSIADYFILCTGRSKRHVKAISDKLIELAKDHQFDLLSVEGVEESEWILVDLGNSIVHIMLPTVREFYDLEGLWSYEMTAAANE